MNDKFIDTSRAEQIAQKINQVAEQTNVNSQFAAELEERLRSAHTPKTSWLASSFKQVSPALRWVALMVLLGLVLSLSIKTLIPAPQPGEDVIPPTQDAGETPTPAPQGETFDYHGAQLIMNVPFPDSPAQANVYTALRSQPATAEYAQKLAAQFGIEGELYTTLAPGQSPDQAQLVVTDGKQQLLIYAENNYTYTSDMVKYSRANTSFPNENAEAIIREYLNTRGFDLNFRVEAEGGPFGGYLLQQLSPEDLPMESNGQSSTRVTLDEEGNILSINMSIIDYEPASLGNFGIITVEEALEQLLDEPRFGGVLESAGSVPDPNLTTQSWYHDYPDNQTVTVYGNISSYQALDSNTPAMVFIDNVPLTGNTNGMEALEGFTFVQVTGQFVVENGVRKLNVDAWSQDVEMTCASGSARSVDGKIIITNEAESVSEYTLVAPPADLPLNIQFPDSQLITCGVVVDGQFYWTSIQYYPDSSQMGGGGGGGGVFYQLNLNGAPVPFPTATPIQQSAYSSAELSGFPQYIVQSGDTLEQIAASYNVSVEDIMQANGLPDTQVAVDSMLIIPTTRLEGDRGIVNVQIYQKPDGRQRTSYTFISERDQSYFQLRGDNLEPLQKMANRPIKIWGDLSGDETGTAFLHVEKFEPLYPNLQFQILTGTQELKEIDGEEAVLFTTGGTTYMQLGPNGGYPDYNYFEDTEEVIIEVLQIPDETYAGYPAIRVFNSTPATDPISGEPIELQPSADTIEVLPDPFGNADHYIPPNVVIEKVELIYFVLDPTYYGEAVDPTQVKIYLQPAWYFQGHNENGDEVDILVQALKQEYLLPETEP